MTFLFTESGLQRLNEIIRPGALCVFDFDGTLAPIATRHQDARLPTDILKQLLQLSMFAPVGIITGRSIEDIRGRLGFTPHFVIGNHGLEGVPGWEKCSENYEALSQAWAEEIYAALQQDATFDPRISLENKRYSLSVHFRHARDSAGAERQLSALFERLLPRPRIMAGKCVFNLLPQGAADKGSALEQLMRETGAPSAIYVGDDITDEDVFRLQRRDILSVRIEKRASSKADFFLNDRIEIAQLLDELIARSRNLQAEKSPS